MIQSLVLPLRVEQYMFDFWVTTVSAPDDQIYLLKRAEICSENRQKNPIKYAPVRLIDAQDQIIWLQF